LPPRNAGAALSTQRWVDRAIALRVVPSVQLSNPVVVPSDTSVLEVLRRCLELGLTAAVRVVNETVELSSTASPDGHLEGIEGEVGAQRSRRLPADYGA